MNNKTPANAAATPTNSLKIRTNIRAGMLTVEMGGCHVRGSAPLPSSGTR